MPWRDWHNHDPAPARTHDVSTHDAVWAVVAAFDDHIGLKRTDEFEGGVLGEHDDRVDTLERGKKKGTLGFGAHWARGPLEPADRRVAVHSNDEQVPSPSRRDEDVEMAGVQQIEYAVGENDRTRAAAAPPLRRITIKDLSGRVERQTQNGPDACGLMRTSLTMPGSSTT